MKFTTLLTTALLPLTVFAQNRTGLRFTNTTQIGVLYGKSENVPSLQTINGIAFKKSSLGIGVGYDTYGYKSIPLFLDARRYWGNRACKLVLYADLGLNLPLHSNALPQKWNNGTDAYTFNTTAFAEGGLGLSNKIGRKVALTLTLGYSYKHFSYTEHSSSWYAFPYVYSWGNSTYDYYYRRLALRLGLQFN